MKKTKIIYWVFTGLLILFMGPGAVFNAISSADSVTLFKHLQQPLYMIPFLGIAKLLGLAAILIPGYPRIKEWAYAGFTYDICGAIYSVISVGDPVSQWFPLLIGLAAIFGSYIYYHKRQREIKMAAVKS